MKQKKFNLQQLKEQRLLILSDGKPGHVNQSIAFAKLLHCDYDVVDVRFRCPGGKAISYLLDRVGVYWRRIFRTDSFAGQYAAVVSAGSATYYANRTLAKRLQCSAVAIMFPRGYRLGFELIIAQQHDHPPQLDNVLCLPVNLSMTQPGGIVRPVKGKKYLGLVIGGDSHHGKLSVERLKQQIDTIIRLLPKHQVWLTTSRRTPHDVERMLAEYALDFSVFYSQQQINPIPDFLEHCDIVFITADSSSMISEAVSNGNAAVEILPITDCFAPAGKFKDMIDPLIVNEFVHIFDGSIAETGVKKIVLDELIFNSNLNQ